jgi:predicted amidohydrolase
MSMHICHDGRYPEVWTLPVMFGARLVLHPSNGGDVSGSVDAFEAGARRASQTTHAFHLHVNGGGGSFIAGPNKNQAPLAVSDECRRDNPAFPQVGPAAECLLDAVLPVHEAYGFWPLRSYRVSEEAAAAYVQLYWSLGGRRPAPGENS